MASIHVPEGQTIVQVSVVDNGARISGPISMFIESSLLDHLQAEAIGGPACVFLIEHEKLKRKIVFDLGIRRGISSYAPLALEYHKAFRMQPGRDIFEVLQDGNINLGAIEAVIWRYVSL